MRITVDPEFEELIPPLSPAERAQLEKSLQSEGCRDPLVIWPHGRRHLLVDGHHRYRICQEKGLQFTTVARRFQSREEAVDWIVQNQCARRNLPRFALVELQLRREEVFRAQAKANQRQSLGREQKGRKKSPHLTPVRVGVELAKAAGVSPQTVHRVRTLKTIADDRLLERLRKGTVTINQAFRQIRPELRRQQREAEQGHMAGTLVVSAHSSDLNIKHDDFRKAAEALADESVSLILTDPPYGKDWLPLYSDLGRIAARVLKTGGSLLVYTGQQALPQIFAALSAHLRYFWLIGCRHEPAHEPPLRQYRIRNRWKPIAWYIKGERSGRERYLTDLLEYSRDKRYHHLGQSLGEAKYLAEYLTNQGDLIWDPCCGGGTVPLAAAQTRRRWQGCDCDRKAVLTARRRIEE